MFLMWCDGLKKYSFNISKNHSKSIYSDSMYSPMSYVTEEKYNSRNDNNRK